MKKGKLWAIVVLCSFFTQQIFAYSGESIGTNIEIVHEQEEIFEPIEIIELQDIVPEGTIEEVILDEEIILSESGSTEIIEQEENIGEDTESEFGEGDQIEIIEYEEEIIEDKTISQSGGIIPENESENNFNFGIKFQNPSYILEKDIEKTEYICNSDKEECKVNIIYVDDVGDNLSSDYECITEYSQGFENDNRCNPTTIIFTETTQVNYTVYLKNSPENKRQKSLKFIRENNISDGEKNEEDNNQSDENNTGTGETIPGETIPGENNNIGSGSGDTTGSGIIIEDNQNIDENIHNNILPEIILEVQSGLAYSGTGNIYICEKEYCKINLDISESFTGSFSESDYACEWDFGSGSFSTQDTDKKCNPGYVNYGSGIHEISAKIVNKEYIDSFTGSSWVIENIIIQDDNISEANDSLEDNEGSGTGEILTGSGFTEGNTATGSEIGTGSGGMEIFLFPEIYINIQSGGEYIDNENIKCNKEACKINLDVTGIFSEDFLENKYKCTWDFGSGSFSSQSTINKCNPGYVDYIIGEDLIVFKLFEKDNLENYIEKTIYISNKKIEKKSSSVSGGSYKKSSSVVSKDYGKITENKDIIIQSGLENNSCNSELCKINLDYDNASYESCKWDFGNIQVQDKYKNTCNPGFIYASTGLHKITVEIFNKKTNKEYNKELIFYNSYIKLESNIKPEFDIILQGKAVDYKKYYNSQIICLGVEKCNINLNVETNSKDTLEYNWDFGNGENSDFQNPRSVWFTKGKYEIILTILGDNINEQKHLKVEVIGKEVGIEQQNIVEEFQFETKKENSFFTQIQTIEFSQIKLGKNMKKEIFNKSFMKMQSEKINQLGWFSKKNSENKKLKLTRNISKQKKSLKYSGITFPNSNIYILQGDEIIEIESDNTGKYSQKFTDVRAGNYDVEYYVLDSKGNLFENTKEKLLTLSNEYVESINNRNLKSASNKYVKKIDKSKMIEYKTETKNIKNIQHASILPEIRNKTTNLEYIFQFSLLVLTIIGSSILLRRYKIL